MSMIILRNIQYRLSRIFSGGVQIQDYNRIIMFSPEFLAGGSPYFLEGFNAKEVIIESYRTTWSFRKQTLVPAMDFDFDRLKIVGSEINRPQLRSRLSLTPAPFALKANEEQDVFSCKFRDVDASTGIQIEAFNSELLGTNTNIELYDRDVQNVCKQRNVLGSRARLTPTPAPEKVTEMLLEAME